MAKRRKCYRCDFKTAHHIVIWHYSEVSSIAICDLCYKTGGDVMGEEYCGHSIETEVDLENLNYEIRPIDICQVTAFFKKSECPICYRWSKEDQL